MNQVIIWNRINVSIKMKIQRKWVDQQKHLGFSRAGDKSNTILISVFVDDDNQVNQCNKWNPLLKWLPTTEFNCLRHSPSVRPPEIGPTSNFSQSRVPFLPHNHQIKVNLVIYGRHNSSVQSIFGHYNLGFSLHYEFQKCDLKFRF